MKVKHHDLNIKNILLIFGLFIMMLLGLIAPEKNKIEYEISLGNKGDVAGINVGTIEEDIYEGPFDVISVTDGDTFRISYHGESVPLRLIGVDAPESQDPREPEQCFSEEATKILAELVMGKEIYLERDLKVDDVDRYDRLLRYVILETGEDLGMLLLGKGAVWEYEYTKGYKYSAEYKEAEQKAKKDGVGLWDPENCVEYILGAD